MHISDVTELIIWLDLIFNYNALQVPDIVYSESLNLIQKLSTIEIVYSQLFQSQYWAGSTAAS